MYASLKRAQCLDEFAVPNLATCTRKAARLAMLCVCLGLVLSWLSATPAVAAAAWSAVRRWCGLALAWCCLAAGLAGGWRMWGAESTRRERIPVDVIAGTSMGAIVGALRQWLVCRRNRNRVLKLDWNNVFCHSGRSGASCHSGARSKISKSPLLEVGIGSDGIKAPLGSVSSRGLEAHLRRLTLSARQVKGFRSTAHPIPSGGHRHGVGAGRDHA